MTDFDQLPVHPGSVPESPVAPLGVDDLAQLIRIYDGKNDLGAGALAERLIPHIEGYYAALAESHAELLKASKAVYTGFGPAIEDDPSVMDALENAIARAERVGGN